MLADLNEQGALAAAQALGERADAVHADVTKEEDVAALVQKTVERFGGIDLFVSNAGIVRSGPLDKLEKEDFDLVTSVNYSAFFICAKYASVIMTAQHEADPAWSGDIVTINSKSGLIGSSRNFAYAGSKFGAIGLVQSFAMELIPGESKLMLFVRAIIWKARYGQILRKVFSVSISWQVKFPVRRVWMK